MTPANGKYKYEFRWWTSIKKFNEWGFDDSYRFKRKKEAEEFCLQLRRHECGEGGAYAYEVGYIFDSKGEGFDPFIFWNEEDGLTK
jgi:hypothetical protein